MRENKKIIVFGHAAEETGGEWVLDAAAYHQSS
jgi:hypothetical protein